MSWWQKKLLRYGLRYGLSRTGLLDDKALDLDNLDIVLGRKNVIDLRDVGLNIKRIGVLAQLPPSLRLEAARILLLRLTIPADFYQSSIVAEVDGVELVLRLDETETSLQKQQTKSKTRSPPTVRTPSHRKTNRRLHTPPLYDKEHVSNSEEDVHIPTTQEVVRSYLMDEPAQERKALEESLAASKKGVEESFVSESSEGDELGIGLDVGIPGFLANFLQGIVNRFKIEIKNVDIRLATEIEGESYQPIPLTLRLRIGRIQSSMLDTSLVDVGASEAAKRRIEMEDISLDILSDETALSHLSEASTNAASAENKSTADIPSTKKEVSSSSVNDSSQLQQENFFGNPTFPVSPQNDPILPPSPAAIISSTVRTETNQLPSSLDQSDLEIRPGDDNISWGSRRSQTDAPPEDLWSSRINENDLPESLLLEPERTPTSPHNWSREHRLFESRSRRSVSPHDRYFRSPGSWPMLQQSPPQFRQPHSPGTWPGPGQSEQSNPQPLFTTPESPDDEETDNMRAALEKGDGPSEEFGMTSEHASDHYDMAESRLFSHEEAQSMYMSAMTSDPGMEIPGAWNSDTQSERHSPVQTRGSPTSEAAPLAENEIRYQDDDQERPKNQSQNVTPRAQTPEPKIAPQAKLEAAKTASRSLLYIDKFSICLPPKQDPTSPPDVPDFESPMKPRGSPTLSRHLSDNFSSHFEASGSWRREADTARRKRDSRNETPQDSSSNMVADSWLQVAVGMIHTQVDIPVCLVLYKLCNRLSVSLQERDDPDSTNKAPGSLQDASLSLTVQIEHFSMSILEHIATDMPLKTESEPGRADCLLLKCTEIQLSKTVDYSIKMGSLGLHFNREELLSLNREESEAEILRTSFQNSPALTVTYKTSPATSNRSAFNEIAIDTLPVYVTLDMNLIDGATSTFGGLSGILGLSSSILSERRASSPIAATKPPKGVRFAEDRDTEILSPELKINGRVGGFTATIKGSSCSLVLRTTSIKTVHRQQGAVMTLENAVITGPHQKNGISHPINVSLTTLRIEYLLTPQDKDLERLLSLLTPSKDSYDTDGDILIDTLIRQRRKGALVRPSIGDVKIRLDDWEWIASLTALADELNKLSAVTKFLPEDERPGILTIVRLKECEIQLPINDRFGKLKVASQDIALAHVGLPALLAFSVGEIRARQSNGMELLHPLLPSSDGLPMLMARMLDDEEQPTIKIKLFNTCIEYSVPVFSALTGIDGGIDAEQAITGIAQSVAHLALETRDEKVELGRASDISASPPKKFTVNLLVHDSAIGLKPRKLSSKAMLVLRDARFSTSMPPEDIIEARLNFRKVSLYIIDEATSEEKDENLPPNRTVAPHVYKEHRLDKSLTMQGFVCVATVMSAMINFRARNRVGEDFSPVEVGVKNELLLLETCADSTQTMLATLGDLIPPVPPSEQPKYLTEPMTIDDMMASFSGDSFSNPPETLFDVEEEAFEPNAFLETSAMEYDSSNYLSQSGISASLYGANSGIFDVAETRTAESTVSEDRPEIAESLLEDDPFEMPTTPQDMRLSDMALMRELRKQCTPAVMRDPIDLGLHENDEFGFDPFGNGQQALQYQQQLVRSGQKSGRSTTRPSVDLPFQLRLREFHLIWHLYDGYDWDRTREGIADAVEQVELKMEERRSRRRVSTDRTEDEPVIGDFLFNSIYIGIPSENDPNDLRRQINRGIDDLASETESMPVSGITRQTGLSAPGHTTRRQHRRRLKLGRSKRHKVSFELKGVSADVAMLPPGTGEMVSSVDIRVRDLEIFDNVPSSSWRKFLTHDSRDVDGREMSKPMVHVDLRNVRTLESYFASEMTVHVSVLPLRLHVDQDTLDFITRFFEFKDERMLNSAEPGEQPFLQRVEVDTVDLCLDYKPKHVDYGGIRSGHTTEFMNFITLEASNIRLRHAIIYGLSGFDALHPTLNNIWMPDIKSNQLPTIMAGLAPVRNLVNLGSGVQDIVAIPIREYRKDGRIIRSIQKGAFQFGKVTTSELARLGAKVALGTQTVLSNAEGLLSSTSASPAGPSGERRASSEQGWHDLESDDEESEPRAISAYANQPLGVLSGLRSARRYLEHDLLTAKDALIAVQGEVLESSGPGAAVAAVAKHAPTVILRPVIGATRAVGTTLLGVGNQIDRSNVRRVDDVSSKQA